MFPDGPVRELNNPTLIPPTIFQTKWCNTFRMTSRTDDKHDEYDLEDNKRSWYVYLGPDIDEIKNYVKRLFDVSQAFKMYIVPKDTGSDTQIEINSNLLSAWSTGYVDTTSYDSKKINLMYVKTWYQTGSGPEMYPHWSVLITDADADGEIASKLYDLIQESEGQSQNKSQMIDICTIAKRNGNDKTFQYPFSPKPSQTAEIKTDSEISAAQLSSLQPYEYYDSETSSYTKAYEIYKFHDLSGINNPYDEYDVKSYDLIARHKTDGDKPAEVRYIPLSALSGGGELISGDANHDAMSDTYPPKSINLIENYDHKFYQLHDFNDPTVRNAASSDVILVRAIDKQDANRPELQYVALSSLSSANVISGDANFYDIGQSIYLSVDGDGNKFYQLYDFGAEGSIAQLTGVDQMWLSGTPLLPSGTEAVVRLNGPGGMVHYLRRFNIIPTEPPTDTRYRN